MSNRPKLPRDGSPSEHPYIGRDSNGDGIVDIVDVEVQDSRSLRGLLENRPAPDAEGIIPGVTFYWAVDEGKVYASDGTQWKVVVEVKPWT